MNARDELREADYAEEQTATFSLRAAQTQDELISTWWRDCDHFKGGARERLQEEYAIALRRLGALVG